jgi:hypothetical protein
VTRWGALVLLAAAAVLLAGCDLATGTVRTATQLQQAGIRNANLNYNDGVATVDYDASPDPAQARQEQDEAARIIWRNLPFRVERIIVTANGGVPPSRDYPRAALEQELGPRPAKLDQSVQDIARRATLIAVVVSLVFLVLIVLVIVLVVRAMRKRPAPQPAGPWTGPHQPWGPPGQQPPGWGPPPQQPPGWGQPPPPQQPWGAPPGPGQPGSQQPPPPPPAPPEGERPPVPPS